MWYRLIGLKSVRIVLIRVSVSYRPIDTVSVYIVFYWSVIYINTIHFSKNNRTAQKQRLITLNFGLCSPSKSLMKFMPREACYKRLLFCFVWFLFGQAITIGFTLSIIHPFTSLLRS